MTNEPATHKSILSLVPTYKRGRYLVVPYWFRVQWIGWQLSFGRMLVGRWVNWYAVAIGPLRISWDLPPAPCDPYIRGYFVGVAESQKLLHDAESALQQARSELDALKAELRSMLKRWDGEQAANETAIAKDKETAQ